MRNENMNRLESCPICGAKEHNEVLTGNDFLTNKGSFTIVECEQCHFHFTNPIPSSDDIGAYYKSDKYISHSSTKKGLINYLYNVVRKRTLKCKINWITSKTSDKRLLDIGSGTGHFLSYAKNNGFECTGLEPDQDARDFAKSENSLDLLPLTELYNLKDNAYDVITMWHVLEHVYDLRKQLQKITSLLSENGKLFIAVPNMNSYDARYYKSFWAAYDLPRHLYHFQKENIQMLLADFQMEMTDVIPMKYDSYYVSMLSEKYKKRFFLFGFCRGFLSNLKSKKFGYSSQVYVFEKWK